METELVSLREFGRRKKWNPGYVHKLKVAGRLVMKDEKVDVTASERRIAESADPARSHLQRAQTTLSQPIAPDAYVPQAATPPLSSNATFTKAKTATQVYDAKLRELEYRQKSGALIDVSEAKRMAFTAFRMLRDSILNVPSRIKDQCAAEVDAFKVEQIIEKELTDTLNNFDIAAVVRESEEDEAA